ncbi:MAG: bifunctional glutamate N-acetyltransferase/amino-acid acetyltransferase ArgJ, partial [Actinomycetota bacterium]
MTTTEGFEAAGVAAGIKKSRKSDLGLLVSTKPCVSAAVYTLNAAAAAPVKVCREETEAAALQGIVVNSGDANACTGEQGLADARRMVRAAAEACGLPAERMAVASTGVIGELLPMERLEAGINEAAAELSRHGGGDFAAAIQTTDRFIKEGAVKVEFSSGTVTIGACAKGAGMIAPDMATMLAFITTDAGVPAGLLQDMLMTAASRSFNAVSVDGDMSTNDCVFMFANGASGVTLEAGSDDTELFTTALAAVCWGLALKIVADGEGATRVIELKISGAAAPEEAARVARTVANSPLVKTAFYGSDANWGRILASAGA